MENIFNLLPTNITSSLGWTLLNSIWQSLFLLIIYNTYSYFINNSTKKYNVGLVLLFAQITLSIINFSIIYGPQLLIKSDIASSTIDFEIGKRISGNSENLPFYSSFIYWLNSQLNLIVAIWVIGLAYFSGKFCINLWQIKVLKTQGTQRPNSVTLTIFDNLLNKIKCTRPIKLLESNRISSPVLIGHFKAILLMPIGLCSQLSQAEIEAIFAHELAHLNRNDFLVNLLQSFVDIVYFFNPAIQYLSYQIREEREDSCDEYAAEIVGSKLPIAKALVSLEAYRQEVNLAMAFSKKGSPLKKRIQKLLGTNSKKMNYNFGLSVILFLFLFGIFYTESSNLSAQNNNEFDLDSNSLIIISKNHLFPMTVAKGNKKIIIKRENETIFLNGKEVKMPLVDSKKLDFHYDEIKRLEALNRNNKIIFMSVGNENMDFYYVNDGKMTTPDEINKIIDLLDENDKLKSKIDSSNSLNKNEIVYLRMKVENNSKNIDKLIAQFDAKQDMEIAKLNLAGIKTVADFRAIKQQINFHENEMKKMLPNEVLVAFKDIASYEMFKSGTPPPPPPPPAFNIKSPKLAPPAPPEPVLAPKPPKPPKPEDNFNK
jgi:bla regulator protein blaR1